MYTWNSYETQVIPYSGYNDEHKSSLGITATGFPFLLDGKGSQISGRGDRFVWGSQTLAIFLI